MQLSNIKIIQVNTPVTFSTPEWHSFDMSEKINHVNRLRVRRENEIVNAQKKKAERKGQKTTKKRKKLEHLTTQAQAFLNGLPLELRRGLT